jgi:hypothetical protein
VSATARPSGWKSMRTALGAEGGRTGRGERRVGLTNAVMHWWESIKAQLDAASIQSTTDHEVLSDIIARVIWCVYGLRDRRARTGFRK